MLRVRCALLAFPAALSVVPRMLGWTPAARNTANDEARDAWLVLSRVDSIFRPARPIEFVLNLFSTSTK